MSSSVTSKESASPAKTDRGVFASLTGVIARGVAAGVTGGLALALFFLIVDGAQGVPLRTPSFIANALVGSTGVELGFGLIVLYTIIHFAAFVALGVFVSWLLTLVETASPVLLGLVLGFLMFDVLFYGSVVITGVNVVQELGWPEVLAGNLIAGVCMLGTLHLLGATQPVTWMESFSANRVVREGVVAGLIGAVIVAGWFLIFDLMRGQPFFTPAALGSTLFLGANSLAGVSVTPVTVLGYTLLHFSAFILAGFLAAESPRRRTISPRSCSARSCSSRCSRRSSWARSRCSRSSCWGRSRGGRWRSETCSRRSAWDSICGAIIRSCVQR